MLLQVGTVIEGSTFDKDMELQTITTGTQVTKIMMKIKQHLKGVS